MNTQAKPPARNTKVMNRFDLTKRLVTKLKHEEAVIGNGSDIRAAHAAQRSKRTARRSLLRCAACAARTLRCVRGSVAS